MAPQAPPPCERPTTVSMRAEKTHLFRVHVATLHVFFVAARWTTAREKTLKIKSSAQFFKYPTMEVASVAEANLACELPADLRC